MTSKEAENKYLEYLEGHIGNVKEAFELLCTLDIPFIKDNFSELNAIICDHDASKYENDEWIAYLHHFYPTCDEDSLKTEEFEEACRHHIKNNPHHWDYWVEEGKLQDDIDEHEYKLYTVERLCDHMAMSIQNDNKPDEWYFANKDHIIMPDYGYEFYEDMLAKLPKDYDLSYHGTRNDDKPERDKVNESTINEDAIDEYIKSLNIDESDFLNNYDTQISEHYKYIRLIGRKINNAKYDSDRNELKRRQDFYKLVYQRLKEMKANIKIKDMYTGGDGNFIIELNPGYVDAAGNDYVIAKTKEEAMKMLDGVVHIENEHVAKSLDDVLRDLGDADEEYLTEAKASQLRNKTKSEDPARVKKSKNVKTTYIGMSKFGVLNFKTTSESRSGYHYQTVEFQSMKPLESIIKKNGKVVPDDIKRMVNEEDINVFCTDESFSYWAWYSMAYQNDYAYIDDNIPNLDKRLQSPKVNNVRLKGALCKHLYSVLEYITRPFVLLAISDDVNKFLSGEIDKYKKQTTATQNWYDAVKTWDAEDATDYLGMSREQIIADLSKSIKVDTEISLEDYVDDLVKDAIKANKGKEDPKLEKEIADKIIDELNLEDEYNKMKPEEEVIPDEENIE